MKQGKTIGIILIALDVILILVCIVLYLGADRQKPQLSFQASEFLYHEGMDTESLLQGITAYDSRNGDITERIVIEKTIENRDDNTIVVFYAVADEAGNVAKASRVFIAVYN